MAQSLALLESYAPNWACDKYQNLMSWYLHVSRQARVIFLINWDTHISFLFDSKHSDGYECVSISDLMNVLAFCESYILVLLFVNTTLCWLAYSLVQISKPTSIDNYFGGSEIKCKTSHITYLCYLLACIYKQSGK